MRATTNNHFQIYAYDLFPVPWFFTITSSNIKGGQFIQYRSNWMPRSIVYVSFVKLCTLTFSVVVTLVLSLKNNSRVDIQHHSVYFFTNWIIVKSMKSGVINSNPSSTLQLFLEKILRLKGEEIGARNETIRLGSVRLIESIWLEMRLNFK